MRVAYALIPGLAIALASSQPVVAIQKMARPAQVDIWKPATTPAGGVSLKVLEATREITSVGSDGYILSKPIFTTQVKALAGKRIKVTGWMDVIEPGRKQSHFVLLGYPPGRPFHWHALPNQFIEVKATTPFPLNTNKPFVVSGVLELTGHDESGIFYRVTASRPDG